MKRIITPIGILLVTGLVKAQLSPLPGTENYIQTKTYLDYMGSNPSKSSETVQYFDGLGRPKQVISIKATPQGKDVVTHIEYDQFGRQVKDYLPVPQSGTQNGVLYTSPLGNMSSVYGSEKIFSEKILENSPLDRIRQQIQVGNDWSNKPVAFDYEAVTVADGVRKFITTTTWQDGATKSVLAEDWLYRDGELYKNTVTDEDGNKTTEFKDGQGQLIMVKKDDGSSTYYVYNEYNQLAFVIPPLASIRGDIVSNTAKHDELCYQYRYDGRNRPVEKKLPGKGWEYMVYDKQDRLVATRDAVLKAKGQWLYTKYDKFGRVAITGISKGNERAAEQDIVNGYGSNNVSRLNTVLFERQGMNVYYGNPDNTYPNSSKWVTLLSLNYYDSFPGYSFNPSFPSSIQGEPTLMEVLSSDGRSTNGMPVLSLVKNLEDDKWTKNYLYYDQKGRAIGSYSINHLGGYTRTESVLDFAGVPQKTFTYHQKNPDEPGVDIKERFVYDHGNRLKQHFHQVDDQPEELLTENSYNELSELVNKKVGNNLQSIDYSYNIRGWLTDINKNEMAVPDLSGKLFAYTIRYTERKGIENPDAAQFAGKNVLPKFNGNIAEIDWRAVEVLGVNPSINPKRYGYAYDGLNRLTAGYYQNPNNPYSKENTESLSYDLNGNITGIYRTSVTEYGSNTPTVIDNLAYTYAGNQAVKIKDDSGNVTGYEGIRGYPIEYDANGNMNNMYDKFITGIYYNHLNLQNFMMIGYDPTTSNIKTNYRADGTKVRKVYTNISSGIAGVDISTQTTDYLDGFQYVKSTYSSAGGGVSELQSVMLPRAFEPQAFTPDIIFPPMGGTLTATLKNSDLQFFPTAEGFYDYKKDQYIYQYKDHLGNIRLSFGKNSTGALEIVDANDYYPFGMNHLKTGNAFFGQESFKKYKYQGQELQETGWYNFKWRNYMPDVGRFFNVDPLSEKYAYQSHYNFSENKVTSYRELEGLEAVPADNFKKSDQMLVVIALGRNNGMYGDGIKNGKTLYNNFSPSSRNDDGLSLIGSRYSINNAQVITYAGSDSGITAGDISKTVANYRSVNPDGRVALIGHSLGGADVLNAANMIGQNKNINNTVNLVMTMEAAAVDNRGTSVSVPLAGNTQNIINVNSYDSSMKGGGGTTTTSSQNLTTVNLPIGTNHTNMDNTLTPYIAPILNNMNKGTNPVNLINNINFNKVHIRNNGDLDPKKKGGTSGY